ncbi:putative ADP-ribosylation factor GTPase-activating protein AGD11 [Citrus sinensis]|nr:putative ADP-ribosylation factor GTPase-activating protein AGD11 [Citrus sinensis]
MGGNIAVNKKYEAYTPGNLKKPSPNSFIDERSDFIRRKYEKLEFFNFDEQALLCPYPAPHRRSSSSSTSSSSHDKKHYEKQATRHRIGIAFRNSWGRKESESKNSKKANSLVAMVEFVGLIKVNVVKGTNLAVRDVMTSDPYVILALGHQTVKTRVIKSNLNPVWNESLMLSIPENIPPLKVLVYDKDTFTTDDFMGDAEIDIQPLVTAARACETSNINESMQLGKWVAGKDNTLVNDGIITLVDGKVKQEINLRLQNVERGVLEIELEFSVADIDYTEMANGPCRAGPDPSKEAHACSCRAVPTIHFVPCQLGKRAVPTRACARAHSCRVVGRAVPCLRKIAH